MNRRISFFTFLPVQRLFLSLFCVWLLVFAWFVSYFGGFDLYRVVVFVLVVLSFIHGLFASITMCFITLCLFMLVL